MTKRNNPVVFLGPSARKADLLPVLPNATYLPPIARNDLYRAREQGGQVFLMIDGVFTHHLAVSPREVIDVIRDGALVYGASSMGALRGAECWPLGMRGLGVVTRLYRLGILTSDDDVAVATNPDDEYAALSVALVNVRYALSRAHRRGLLDKATARTLFKTAQQLAFQDRRWPLILRLAGCDTNAASLLPVLASFDIKKKDAIAAAAHVSSVLRDEPQLTSRRARKSAGRFTPVERYPGHQRLLGRSADGARAGLLKWLFGSGRYQPYIWALASGEPELRAVALEITDPDERAAGRRDALAAVLTRRLDDLPAFASDLWAELGFLEELDAEQINEMLAKNVPFDTLEFIAQYAAQFGKVEGIEGRSADRLPNLMLIGYLLHVLEERLDPIKRSDT